MANRAYLFVTNGEDRSRRTSGEYPENWYYDSRWCIPLAWFFFFRADDVRLVPVKDWHELVLVTDKKQAIERFNRRECLLMPLIDASVGWRQVLALRNELHSIAGCNLILDPNEVLGGMSEDETWHADRFRTILRALDSSPPLDPAIGGLLDGYIGPRSGDADRTLGQMVGYTYVREGRNYGFGPESE